MRSYADVVSERLRADKEFVLKMVKCDPDSLSCVHESLKSDRDIVKAAVERLPHTLCFASDEMRDDYEIVALAIREASLERNSVTRLCNASERLRDDKIWCSRLFNVIHGPISSPRSA